MTWAVRGRDRSDAAAALRLELRKEADAPARIALTRADGSAAFGRLGPTPGYGPVYDLAHFVVEQALGLSDATLGLVARGWSLADVHRRSSTALPPAARWAESWAVELSREVATGRALPADVFNVVVRDDVERDPTHRSGVPALEDAELDGMRRALEALWARWRALPSGGTLELTFVPGVRTRLDAGPA